MQREKLNKPSMVIMAKSEIERPKPKLPLHCTRASPATSDFQFCPPARLSGLRRSSTGGDEGGIKAVTEKLMMDLQVETDRIRVAILGEGSEKAPVTAPVEDPPSGEVEMRWNLRERRERVKVDGGVKFDLSPARDEAPTRRKRERRPELSVSLSWREIEEDFMEILGHRPPRRPKKRPKALQNEIDRIFPGLGLSKITPDRYKVYDGFETQKVKSYNLAVIYDMSKYLQLHSKLSIVATMGNKASETIHLVHLRTPGLTEIVNG